MNIVTLMQGDFLVISFSSYSKKYHITERNIKITYIWSQLFLEKVTIKFTIKYDRHLGKAYLYNSCQSILNANSNTLPITKNQLYYFHYTHQRSTFPHLITLK